MIRRCVTVAQSSVGGGGGGLSLVW